MIKVEIDITDLVHRLDYVTEAARNGAIRGMHDVLDDWQREARDEAPIDTGQLRRLIETKLNAGTGPDLNMEGIISSNAYRDGFNYAYYQHNVRGNRYLERPIKRNEGVWKNRLESEIQSAVRKAGW